MPPRQLMVFRIGCIAALLTAALHLVAHVSGGLKPANDTETKLIDLATNYKFALPGGAQRSLMDFEAGYSLSFVMLIATMGVTGLVVLKRGREDKQLMLGVARTLATASFVLSIIALTHFFIVPAMCLVLMWVCFAMSSVASPEST